MKKTPDTINNLKVVIKLLEDTRFLRRPHKRPKCNYTNDPFPMRECTCPDSWNLIVHCDAMRFATELLKTILNEEELKEI